MSYVTSCHRHRHALVFLLAAVILAGGLPASAASRSASPKASGSPRTRPAAALHTGNPIELQFTATVITSV